jgi:hypothetical protein
LAGLLRHSNPGVDEAGFASMLTNMEPFSRYPDQLGLLVKRAMSN